METLMTIADLAEKMRLSEATIRSYVLKKTVPFLKIGAAIRFSPSGIEEWIKAGKGAPSRGQIRQPKGVV